MIIRTKRSVILVSILVSFVRVLGAQTKPNFSGNWKLNSLESDFGMLPTPASRIDVIEHNEPSLKISTDQTGAQGTQSEVAYYITDGHDSMNKLGTLDVRSKVFWHENDLVVQSIVYIEDGQMNSNSVWMLSDDGRTLTQRTHLKIATHDIEQKLVFDKTDGLGQKVVAPKLVAPATDSGGVTYSGVWTLNIAKSDFGAISGPDVRIDTIDHHEPSIKIDVSEDSAREGRQEYTTILTSDGRAAASHFAGLDAKSTASWEAQNLVVNTWLVFQGNDVAIKTTYLLSKDGKTLTQHSHIKSPTGDTDQKLVFEKR